MHLLMMEKERRNHPFSSTDTGSGLMKRVKYARDCMSKQFATRIDDDASIIPDIPNASANSIIHALFRTTQDHYPLNISTTRMWHRLVGRSGCSLNLIVNLATQFTLSKVSTIATTQCSTYGTMPVLSS